jgi:hypothetical protein
MENRMKKLRRVMHLKKNSVILLIVFLIFSFHLKAQYYQTGTDLGNISWRQINTKKFKLVYDSTFEHEAQRLAAIIDYSDTIVGNTIHQKEKKIPILIHNHSVISNGMVTWAPKRMELYPVPPQDNYPQDWFEQLAIHESRHVVQINRVNRGFTKVMSVLAGEQGNAASLAFIHPWFLEGDAVVTETSLSNVGRGRDPSFEMEYRSIALSNRYPYNFKKAVFGSFKDYVPDIYHLGFLMVAYNRANYGPQLWENVIDVTAKYPFTLFPFYIGVKKNTKLSRSALYYNTMFNLKNQWEAKAKEIKYSPAKIINKEKKDFKSYRNACILNDSIIIAITTGIDDIKRIVKININTHNEEIIFTPGSTISNSLSLSGKYLVWDEYLPDLRWEQKNYSVIRLYKFETGKAKYLTHKTRYFSPAISPDGKRIAVCETDIKGQQFLKLISAETGKELEAFASPENLAIQTPAWDNTSTKLIMTNIGSKGKSIVELNTMSGSWNTLYGPTFENISQPIYYKHYIVYHSSLTGIENLFALSTFDRKIFQITSSKFGAFDPKALANTESIVYSDYTSQGYDIALIKDDSVNWIPFERVTNISLDLADRITAQEPVKFNSSEIKYKKYDSKEYSKIGHLINIHSWIPAYNTSFSADLKTVSLSGKNIPGFTLMSQNLLGTLVGHGGLGYYQNNLYSSVTLSLQAFYPVFEIKANTGGYSFYRVESSVVEARNKSFSFQTYLPLNLSKGKYFQSIVPSFGINYYTKPYASLENEIKSGLYRLVYSLSIDRTFKSSTRDLYPSFGESLSLTFAHTPAFQNFILGKYFNVSSSFYFPGIFKHNSTIVRLAFEKQTVKRLLYSGIIQNPRGFLFDSKYDSISFSQKKFVSIDYAFPFLYPEVEALGFIYVPRLKGDLYAENVTGLTTRENKKNEFTSTGIELTADFNLFNIPVMWNAGIRYAYRPSSNKWVKEGIFGISITGF